MMTPLPDTHSLTRPRTWSERWLICLACVLPATSGWAQALTVPDTAGQQLQDHLNRLEPFRAPDTPRLAPTLPAPSTPAPPAEARIELQEIQFSTSELLDADELRAIGMRYVGKTLGARDIQQVLDDVAALYRAKGILTAVPVLPAQDLNSGLLRILLVEGRLGDIKIRGSGMADPDWVSRWFHLPTGVVVTQEMLRQDLLHFNLSSDMTATAEFIPGDRFGRSDLQITLSPQNTLQGWGFYEANSASGNAAQWAVGVRAQPLSFEGGRIDAAALGTRDGTTFTLAAGLPIGTDGWRLGANTAYSRSHTLFGDTDPLRLRGESATAAVELATSWVLDTPWVLNSSLSLGMIRSRTYIEGDSIPLLDNLAQQMTLGSTLYYDQPDARGQLRLAWHQGWGDSGHYRFADLNGLWQSQIDDAGLWQWKVHGLMRFANRQLPISADRFQLGGADTVRGYDGASVIGRRGSVLQWELRYRTDWGVPGSTELYTFYDIGTAEDVGVRQTLRSMGLGLQARLHRSLTLDMSATRQLVSLNAQDRNRLALRMLYSY